MAKVIPSILENKNFHVQFKEKKLILELKLEKYKSSFLIFQGG